MTATAARLSHRRNLAKIIRPALYGLLSAYSPQERSWNFGERNHGLLQAPDGLFRTLKAATSVCLGQRGRQHRDNVPKIDLRLDDLSMNVSLMAPILREPLLFGKCQGHRFCALAWGEPLR